MFTRVMKSIVGRDLGHWPRTHYNLPKSTRGMPNRRGVICFITELMGDGRHSPYFNVSFAPSLTGRMAELREQETGDLVWYRAIVTLNGLANERCLHELFADRHVRNKWFVMTAAEADWAADHLTEIRCMSK